MNNHAEKAKVFLRDELRADWQDKALWDVRLKRDEAANAVAEWEGLREYASRVKEHVLSDLDYYLLKFEHQAVLNGVIVHWAGDAREFNQIVLDIINSKRATKIVKSKSMLTEECGLNQYLHAHGLKVTDTDLGELIIQLRNEVPSHIVLPAIHLMRQEVGDLFHEKLHSQEGNADPEYLTQVARAYLRERFLEAEVAITGVNFAVADSGTVVVCTNEGNADMGVHAAPVQIHCMGIEKIIPGANDLGVFLRLLARSATGQQITSYTSHFRKPKKDGEMHIVILDNGRSSHLGNPLHWKSLKCIRCGACMNTCPVYRRSGGHSYEHVIPGPIGSILAPLNDLKGKKDLPFASSLCGSCSEVCPVKIDIHTQLYNWRQEIGKKGLFPFSERLVLKIIAKVMASNALYNFAGKMARWAIRKLPGKLVYHRLNTWGIDRELPLVPEYSFKEWYKRNRKLNKHDHVKKSDP